MPSKYRIVHKYTSYHTYNPDDDAVKFDFRYLIERWSVGNEKWYEHGSPSMNFSTLDEAISYMEDLQDKEYKRNLPPTIIKEYEF